MFSETLSVLKIQVLLDWFVDLFGDKELSKKGTWLCFIILKNQINVMLDIKSRYGAFCNKEV